MNYCPKLTLTLSWRHEFFIFSPQSVYERVECPAASMFNRICVCVCVFFSNPPGICPCFSPLTLHEDLKSLRFLFYHLVVVLLLLFFLPFSHHIVLILLLLFLILSLHTSRGHWVWRTNSGIVFVFFCPQYEGLVDYFL